MNIPFGKAFSSSSLFANIYNVDNTQIFVKINNSSILTNVWDCVGGDLIVKCEWITTKDFNSDFYVINSEGYTTMDVVNRLLEYEYTNTTYNKIIEELLSSYGKHMDSSSNINFAIQFEDRKNFTMVMYKFQLQKDKKINIFVSNGWWQE